jgi:choice-of-anchor C domain-containing protein
MRKSLNKPWLKCGLAALVALPVAASATLVTDGNFTQAPDPGIFTTYFASQTMGGWTVTAGSVDLIGSYWTPPPGGGRSVDMAGNSSGTIEQTISGLVVNQQYQLSFYLSGNPDGPPAVKVLGTILGASTDSFTYTTAINYNHSLSYTLETASFTATSVSEVLQFQDQSSYNGSTPFGAVIGNVSLAPVPETTTMVAGAMFLLPFAFSTLRVLRRNRMA